MYIIEALIAVILNQMQNNRHSIYYATLFALYSLELHTAFINVVNYILQISTSILSVITSCLNKDSFFCAATLGICLISISKNRLLNSSALHLAYQTHRGLYFYFSSLPRVFHHHLIFQIMGYYHRLATVHLCPAMI
ncbi:hypothetical protein T08_15022 [Trichinella sp. T8]|nr:hypothetical protein T08_15022 [Trichinella sp. T8]